MPPVPPKPINEAVADFFTFNEKDTPLRDTAMKTLVTLLTNASTKEDSKYRIVKLSNPAIQARITAARGAIAILRSAGFEPGNDVMQLPDGASVEGCKQAIAELHKAEEDRLAKIVEARKAADAAKLAAAQAHKEKIRKQLEDDKRERAAKPPETKGSVAQKLPSQFGGAGGSKGGGSGSVTHVTSAAEFQKAIAGPATVVDFFTEWCGPCKAIAPKFAELASAYPNINFIKVNIEEVTDAAPDIQSIPTFRSYKNGSMVSEVKGADPNALENLVRSV